MRVFYIVGAVITVSYVLAEITLSVWIYKTTKKYLFAQELVINRNESFIGHLSRKQLILYKIHRYLKIMVVCFFVVVIIKKLFN